MNSFQYAIAKAAWEAHYEAKNEAQSIGGFDKLDAENRRALGENDDDRWWISAAPGPPTDRRAKDRN